MTVQPASTDTLTKLHVITYLNWEREGMRPYEPNRADFLDVVSTLMSAFSSIDPDKPHLKNFLMGGQTILLHDIEQVRPDLMALLLIYNSSGRLGVGPWYVQVDGILAGGESLVRDLLFGREDARKYGLKALDTAYLPRMTQYSSQLPQILRGFGIDSVFLSFSHSHLKLPFRWEAPEGSYVLVNPYNSSTSMEQAITTQRDYHPDGPFVWMQPFQTPYSPFADLKLALNAPIQESTLSDVARALRQSLPDGLRPALKGEAYLLDTKNQSGRFSARIHLKQTNLRQQAQLLHHIEPLVTLALLNANTAFAENNQAMLNYTWRNLLQNQSPEVLGGVGVDQVEDHALSRSWRIEDNLARLLSRTVNSSIHPLTFAPATSKTFISVWNGHGQANIGIVSAKLQLADGWQPAVLRTEGDDSVVFAWNESTQTISFKAQAPALGYRVYTLELTHESLSDYLRPHRKRGNSIGNEDGMSVEMINERLSWSFDEERFHNLLTYDDGGDDGSTMSYKTPIEDMLVTASLNEAIAVESTPLGEQLLFQHRLRVAPALEAGKRGRGVRVIDLNTKVQVYYGMREVYFNTQFINNVNDHRLRAHLALPFEPSQLWVDAPFALVKRPMSGIHAVQQLCALQHNSGVLGWMSKGISEYEVQSTPEARLSLTLLRAVGWADNEHTIPAPQAQMQRDINHEFALFHAPSLNESNLLQSVALYNAPMLAHQHATLPPRQQLSYLNWDNDALVFSALKPPQQGKGLVLRVFNPTDKLQRTHLQTVFKVKNAYRYSFAEERRNELSVQNNEITLVIEPHHIVTLFLEVEMLVDFTSHLEDTQLSRPDGL
jgi:mannosylglycerate hydrolase